MLDGISVFLRRQDTHEHNIQRLCRFPLDFVMGLYTPWFVKMQFITIDIPVNNYIFLYKHIWSYIMK